MRPFLWGLAALAILAGIAAIVLRADPPQQEQRRAGRFGPAGPMPVTAATVEKQDIPITFQALGTVTPLATVTVRPRIAGHLVRIGFREGQTVRKGDFLAEIDPRPYELALKQAQAQLQRDRALLRNAEVDLERYRTLVAEDSIARQQLDTQESLVRQYQGTVKADEAQVESARLDLAYCRIAAPVTGRVGLRQVDEGNYVQTNDASGIVVITQMKPISVIFTLPEDRLPTIRKRLRAGAALPVAAYDRTRTTKLATGTLVTIDNQVDPSTGTVKLRANFDNEDESLFPNQFVNVEILADVLSEAAVIPNAAVQRGAQGTFVYEITPDYTVSVRPVTLGAGAGDRVAVMSGIDLGDRIVVDGADKLRGGAKVAVPGERRPAVASDGTGLSAGAPVRESAGEPREPGAGDARSR